MQRKKHTAITFLYLFIMHTYFFLHSRISQMTEQFQLLVLSKNHHKMMQTLLFSATCGQYYHWVSGSKPSQPCLQQIFVIIHMLGMCHTDQWGRSCSPKMHHQFISIYTYVCYNIQTPISIHPLLTQLCCVDGLNVGGCALQECRACVIDLLHRRVMQLTTKNENIYT